MRHDTDSALVSSIYRPLWLTYGMIPLLAGLDKFFNLLTDWHKYLSPTVVEMLPIAPQEFMYIVGVVEMIAGLMVLTWWPKVGAWIVSAWLVCISVNLLTLGAYDIAVRDLGLAVGAMTLARVAAWREQHAPVHTRVAAQH